MLTTVASVESSAPRHRRMGSERVTMVSAESLAIVATFLVAASAARHLLAMRRSIAPVAIGPATRALLFVGATAAPSAASTYSGITSTVVRATTPAATT